MVGLAIFDRIDKELQKGTPLRELAWSRREIENYLCHEEALLAYARAEQPDDLFGLAEKQRREQIMQETIAEVSAALKTLGYPDPWSSEIKASSDFLAPVFKKYFEKLNLPNLMPKTNYHILARFVPWENLDVEIIEKLDAIAATAQKARPAAQE